jgi:glycogen debranching enzyme
MGNKVDKKELIDRAYDIAVSDLRSNYGRLGIYAGPKNHHEYWARDSFFASYGSLAIGDFDIVRKNLELFIDYQSNTGQIPLRVEERYHGFGLVGINLKHRKPRARYKPSQPWAGEAIDSNPLFLIAISEYFKKTGDAGFIAKNSQSILAAISWIVGKFNEKDLVTEGYNAGWADFTFKRGNVAYTNILVWQAFKLLCKTLSEESSKQCIYLQDKLEESIKRNFWSKKQRYYIDHLGKHGYKHKVFASDANLLSIFFDFASKKQGKLIMDFIDRHNLNVIPVPIYFKGLEWKHKFWNDLIYPNYNTDNTFTWWGSISAICRLKLDDTKGAFNDLNQLAKIIYKYNAVPEIVDPKGKLIDLKFYKTEIRSSWAAGMFIYAYNKAKKSDILD